MSYQPIENYGIIGNMRTVALVGMNGSIDWYCYPHFDSPSIFGAILDDSKGGRFQISPVGDEVRHKQFYWPSTNILITRFLLPDGRGSVQTLPNRARKQAGLRWTFFSQAPKREEEIPALTSGYSPGPKPGDSVRTPSRPKS